MASLCWPVYRTLFMLFRIVCASALLALPLVSVAQTPPCMNLLIQSAQAGVAAKVCKKEVNMEAIAQLCGGNTQSEYSGVLKGQACEETVGKEKLEKQGSTQGDGLKAEYNRIGHKQFCGKYAGRQ